MWIGLIVALVAAVAVYFAYRRILRRAKAVERSLKMVPLLIHLPPPSSDSQTGNRDTREVMKGKITEAQVLYDLLAGTAVNGFKSNFYGQRHIALELISYRGVIHFYAAVPVNMVPTVSNAILTAYPGARIEEREDYNIFNPNGKLQGAAGGELVLKSDYAYPIATPDKLDRDPMEALMNAMSNLGPESGVGVQIMLRPAAKGWVRRAKNIVARKRRKGSHTSMQITGRDLVKAAVKGNDPQKEAQVSSLTTLEQQVLDAIEAKTTKPGFEVLVRLVVSSDRAETAQMILRNLATAFALYEAPGLNGFRFLPAHDMGGLATAYIMRYFPPEVRSTVLNSAELAMLYHIPDAQFSANSEVQRQLSKQIDGPVNLPTSGLLLGYNFFRETKKEVRLSADDRRRHTYIVGQTGTGKSTLLENLAVQDMLAGNGFAFIDPHGDAAEKLLSMVPKNRAEDIIYFNPADMDYPLGLNLFEFQDEAQKDFLIQESINMLYKIYDPGKTGIIGPRFEQWYRNAALTLMADPAGATFIEIPKVFMDAEYLKAKFRHLKDPTVIDFWTKEMGQTSDYHKSEMLGWFASKFGAFQQNEMMRNILGQTQSAFNMRDIMDGKKILIVNLSKGKVGELNSQLLGMIFVMKFQAAAMSRASVPEAERQDFCLYVDEFQNFSTDSFATILSEARKYRLNLIVANQFIGQLSDQIRDAVFGNVGTVVSYRTGPEDADFLVKQFAPIFDERDLVNMPNFNAAIRLMIGGLPSQPFSVTALPPLGHANPAMGSAVRQLSAAKFGIARQTVEARIFARLNSRPRPPVPQPNQAPVAAPTAEVTKTQPDNPAAQPHKVTAPPQAASPQTAPAATAEPTVGHFAPRPAGHLAQTPTRDAQPTKLAEPIAAKPEIQPEPTQITTAEAIVDPVPVDVRDMATTQTAKGVPPLKALERSMKVAAKEALGHIEAKKQPRQPVSQVPATDSGIPLVRTRPVNRVATVGTLIMPAIKPHQPTPQPEQPSEQVAATNEVTAAFPESSVNEDVTIKSADEAQKPGAPTSDAEQPEGSSRSGEIYVDEDGNVHTG